MHLLKNFSFSIWLFLIIASSGWVYAWGVGSDSDTSAGAASDNEGARTSRKRTLDARSAPALPQREDKRLKECYHKDHPTEYRAVLLRKQKDYKDYLVRGTNKARLCSFVDNGEGRVITVKSKRPIKPWERLTADASGRRRPTESEKYEPSGSVLIMPVSDCFEIAYVFGKGGQVLNYEHKVRHFGLSLLAASEGEANPDEVKNLRHAQRERKIRMLEV